MNIKCKNCGSEVKAEIKNIMLDKTKLERPVWFCSVCQMSLPVKIDDKYEWVDKFKWQSSFIYGLENSHNWCLGCEKSGTMYPTTAHTRGSSVFPFHIDLHPSYTCYTCGFTDLALKKDRKKWADLYHLWA